MSNIFLSEGTFNLSSGTANIIGSNIGASNLLSGSTVKVNSNKQLYSSTLALTDVQGLTTALGSRLSNPSSVPIIGPSFIRSGGTNSQYLMADGSVTTGGIGATGPTGATGAQGPAGLSSSVFVYTFSNQTTGTPASGHLFINAVPASATILNVNHLDKDAHDIDQLLNNVSVGSVLIVQRANDSNTYIRYQLTSKTVNTGYVSYGLVYLDDLGTIANNDEVLLIVQAQGLQGVTGPTGPAGGAGQLYNNFQQFSYYGTSPTSLFFNMASGCFLTLGGAVANATQASTNMLTRQYRTRQAPSSVADGQDSGWYGTAAVPVVYITGGWRYVYTFGIEDTSTNAPTRTMIGMYSSNTAPVLNAATAVTANTIPFFGICQDVGESTFSFYTRGASSFTKTSTLISCATPGALWYQLTFENMPFSLDVTMTLTAYSTLASASANISFTAGAGSATLPNPTTTFFPLLIRAMCTPTSSGSAVLSLGAIKMHTL